MKGERPEEEGAETPEVLSDAMRHGAFAQNDVTIITPEVDRRNGTVYAACNILIYLAAPVTYVGVVQATLCDKLGASATLANLPTSAYLFGYFAPLVASWGIPHRLERLTIVVASACTASMLALVSATLFFPIGNLARIGAVVGQAAVQGLTASISQVFMLQCLGRGTTTDGRARSFKLAFGWGPVAAVAASLGAQFVLNQGISLAFPHDFALLYLLGAFAMTWVAILANRFRLRPVRDVGRMAFSRYLHDSIGSIVKNRPLTILWIAYVLWYSVVYAMPNLSLYTKEVLDRDPKELAGLIMALRFGFKSLAGFALGAVMLRWGARAPLLSVVLLAGGATLWATAVPGYAFLVAFGWLGAGELGGAYFPNYAVAGSPLAAGTRNQALLALATPAASFAPTLHGILTDHLGFGGSFAFGGLAAVVSLLLVVRLPSHPNGSELPGELGRVNTNEGPRC